MYARLLVAAFIGASTSLIGVKLVVFNGFPLFETAILNAAIAFAVACLFVTNKGLYDERPNGAQITRSR
jgi:hypothetical protein